MSGSVRVCERCGAPWQAFGWVVGVSTLLCDKCAAPGEQLRGRGLPTLWEAAARYVAEGRGTSGAPVGQVAAVVDHVREGFGRWLVRSGARVSCGVDSCPNQIADPMRCAGLFVFTPGLDVVGICERCARVASGDVAAAPGCFAAVPSLYVFGPEDGEQLDKRGDAVHLCPFCGSDDISGDSWEQDGPTVSQVVDCLDCGETWVDSYQFVGFERVERSGGGE